MFTICAQDRISAKLRVLSFERTESKLHGQVELSGVDRTTPPCFNHCFVNVPAVCFGNNNNNNHNNNNNGNGNDNNNNNNNNNNKNSVAFYSQLL